MAGWINCGQSQLRVYQRETRCPDYNSSSRPSLHRLTYRNIAGEPRGPGVDDGALCITDRGAEAGDSRRDGGGADRSAAELRERGWGAAGRRWRRRMAAHGAALRLSGSYTTARTAGRPCLGCANWPRARNLPARDKRQRGFILSLPKINIHEVHAGRVNPDERLSAMGNRIW
jgi:hypothetical protein